LLCLLALLASGGCRQPTDTDRAIATIEKLGGSIRKDGRLAGTPVTLVKLTQSTVNDDQLQVLKAFPQLRVLDLRYTRVSDRGLAHLETLTALEQLSLDGTRVSDLGLDHLSHLQELHKVSLNETAVSDLGLGFLEKLPGLEELSVKQTAVSEKAAQSLRARRKIRVYR
jgi:hypothetical protein